MPADAPAKRKHKGGPISRSKENAGQRIRLWVDSRIQRHLQALAKERGCELQEATRAALKEWATSREGKR